MLSEPSSTPLPYANSDADPRPFPNPLLAVVLGLPSAAAVSKSHRPVHGFKYATGGKPNMEVLPLAANYNRVTYADLTVNTPQNYDSNTTKTRLDWVGRNHGKGA